MSKEGSANLGRPVAASTWTAKRQAERVDYAHAQPSRTNWKTAGTYTGAELQHRSTGQRIPSIILGARVYPGA